MFQSRFKIVLLESLFPYQKAEFSIRMRILLFLSFGTYIGCICIFNNRTYIFINVTYIMQTL